MFHDDCLAAEVCRHVEVKTADRIEELRKKIQAEKRKGQRKQANGNKLRQTLKAELDRTIASECPFCGDMMINASSRLFIQPTEVESIESWKV